MRESDSTSPVALVLATLAFGATIGYFIGQGQSIGLFGQQRTRPSQAELSEDSDVEEDELDEDTQDLGELKTFPGSNEECKLVLVVRNDLGMGKGRSIVFLADEYPLKGRRCSLITHVISFLNTTLIVIAGKIAAQCSHATLACYKAMVKADPAHPVLRQWERLGQAKVALKVDSEDDMLMLQAQAISLGLCARVIHDAGRTQIASGSATVLGIGPAPKSKIDEVTGHLKLL